jgi:hypothetical protein
MLSEGSFNFFGIPNSRLLSFRDADGNASGLEFRGILSASSYTFYLHVVLVNKKAGYIKHRIMVGYNLEFLPAVP